MHADQKRPHIVPADRTTCVKLCHLPCDTCQPWFISYAEFSSLRRFVCFRCV